MDPVIWDMHFPYRSSHLHCQLSHLAANSVQLYLKNEHLNNYLMGRFDALPPPWAASSTVTLVPDLKRKVS